MIPWLGLLAAWPAIAGGGGTVITVGSTADSGMGTLRWAIETANMQPPGSDVTVGFNGSVVGGCIQPLTPLPTITRDHVTIDGDVDDDGKPDIWVDGSLQANGSGLVVSGAYCNIVGLCVTRFPKYGIMLSAAGYCSVYTCHLGVSLDGTDRLSNVSGDIVLWVSDNNHIGGPPAKNRNIIAGSGPCSAGVLVASSHYNKIQSNYIGLRRSGMSALPGAGGYGVYLTVKGGMSPTGATDVVSTPATCLGNTIGGSKPSHRNVIGGVDVGVMLSMAEHNFVQGNYFGLAKDGDTGVPLSTAGVYLQGGSLDNVIGGTSAGARNAFAGGPRGVIFTGGSTAGNRVLGNYFGLNAAGTAQRALMVCVEMTGDAGPQTIGGATAACRNYFAPTAPGPTCGVNLSTAGDGTLIRNNYFGVRPDGPNASLMDCAISVGNVQASIQENLVARARKGIDVGGPSGDARVCNNIFRHCRKAVRITNLGACLLGNLHNASTTDDGGNTFRASNTWHVDNRTAARILAEGNSFDTTVQAQIDAKIYDKLDDATKGRVDFVPLSGGVTPTGGETEPVLALVGVTAEPTPRGAEIVFTLSAPASVSVEVVNIAGRPIAGVAHEVPTEAGLQRLTWAGRTAEGMTAPAGRYLVRVSARDANGKQTTALAPFHLAR